MRQIATRGSAAGVPNVAVVRRDNTQFEVYAYVANTAAADTTHLVFWTAIGN